MIVNKFNKMIKKVRFDNEIGTKPSIEKRNDKKNRCRLKNNRIMIKKRKRVRARVRSENTIQALPAFPLQT